MTDLLDVGLWIVQALLAVVFLLAGAMHAFRYEAATRKTPESMDTKIVPVSSREFKRNL